jgi:hypothetical protein
MDLVVGLTFLRFLLAPYLLGIVYCRIASDTCTVHYF